jgi:hypothetical protein
MKKRNKKKDKVKFSKSDLKQFKDNVRIFEQAVEMAIQENVKAKISEEGLYSKLLTNNN